MAAKNSSKSKLSAVVADTTEKKVRFACGGLSHMSSLLGVESSLPTTRYDPQTRGQVLNVDADAKDDVIDRLTNTSTAVAQTIKLFGLLMASQDEAKGYLDRDASVELGFTLHGLAHMNEQLAIVIQEIHEATPTAVRHG